jgi:murein DD-endopeptidase MepM/ murein hydrolase activator NlpD
MKKALTITGTAVITAVLTSAFWIFAYNIALAPNGGADGRVSPSGDVKVVNPPGGAPVAIADAVEVGPAGLAIPVVGVKAGELVDTFTQARAGGARVHDAIDIMAPTGRPVISVASGTVEKVFYSDGGGGKTVYVRSDDGRWMYYYAHLHDYAPGLKEGQKVARGTPLGTVGFSGNANPAGPHLHFAINRMQPGEKWYNGSPVNPYPLLAARKGSG